jgi:Fe2+ or Zn2+ uptake regulation protein
MTATSFTDPAILKAIIERLRDRGMRMTKNRERVFQALADMDRPISADEVRQKAGLATTDLVTVYRNLEALEVVGVLQRILLENGTQLFELTAPDEHFHHLVCRVCHHTERLDLCLGKQLSEVAQKKGFEEVTHIIEVHGVCEACRN